MRVQQHYTRDSAAGASYRLDCGEVGAGDHAQTNVLQTVMVLTIIPITIYSRAMFKLGNSAKMSAVNVGT
jgi:hypothetical protein